MEQQTATAYFKATPSTALSHNLLRWMMMMMIMKNNSNTSCSDQCTRGINARIQPNVQIVPMGIFKQYVVTKNAIYIAQNSALRLCFPVFPRHPGPHSLVQNFKSFKAQRLTYIPPGLIFENSTLRYVLCVDHRTNSNFSFIQY